MKRSRWWRGIGALLVVAALGVGCGDDGDGGGAVSVEENNAPNNDGNNDGNNAPNNDPNNGGNNGEVCPELSLPSEPAAVAIVYEDADNTDESTYAGGYEGGRDEPLAGVSITLQGPGGLSLETQTCADGRAGFGELEDGVYLLSALLPDGECGQRNCMKQLPKAIASGSVKIVTFGDSVPVVGDEPMFPARLATMLSPLATIDNQNIAVGGTTSIDWLPGTRFFENRLRPQVASADVIMISLGGNDILGYVQGLLGNPGLLNDIPALLAEVEGVVRDVVDNIMTTVTAIREINAEADIVYILYPDYSLATRNQLWSVVNQFVGAESVHSVLEVARASIPPESGVLLVDVFGASEQENLALDDYLVDPLHFNNFGQTLYAEEIFKAFGGVLVGDSPLSFGERTPLGLRQQFSVRVQ